jgi:hypothetical protein
MKKEAAIVYFMVFSKLWSEETDGCHENPKQFIRPKPMAQKRGFENENTRKPEHEKRLLRSFSGIPLRDHLCDEVNRENV